jgi:hypothetical protein
VSTEQSSLAVFPSFAAQHPQTILETASGAPHAVALGDAPAGPTTSTACAPERDNDTDPAGATAFPAYAPGRPDNGASSVSPAVNSEIRQAPLSPTPVNGVTDPAPLINSGGNPAVPQSTPFSVEDSVPSYAVIRRPPLPINSADHASRDQEGPQHSIQGFAPHVTISSPCLPVSDFALPT